MKSKDYTTGGMTGYLQAAAPDRYARVQKYGLELEAFTVCAGDEWNPGVAGGDKSKFSERTEFRSKTEDTVSDGKDYGYVVPVLIPEGYAEFSPKQTLCQWHEGGYPVASLRYENGELAFVTNYKSGFNYKQVVPFVKGRLLWFGFLFRWNPGENAGRVMVTLAGKAFSTLQNHSLVETGTKVVYFKYGIYRSGMDAYKGPKPAPNQTAYFGPVKRAVGDAAFTLVTNPTEPLPSSTPIATPKPAAPVTDAFYPLYKRLDAVQTELARLQNAIGAVSPSSVSLLEGAEEKLDKVIAQMRKAEAKKK
ncbi:heparin lyase I family protein [Aureimonas glaciei]|uniref:Uncharacterized protein n=1 Tax=Aureimonas glaciei TaxID=1776957 RepID=A0A916Y5H3_9HYPH|nr:heparin lyase I family protein [Aureimonas glaciei]GGD31324.1 hypothetical protein GCM10011335_37930 [Aureimonas glaciei]